MYSNDDIQRMIEKCSKNKAFKKKVLEGIEDFTDRRAVESVIEDGWYEYFDRYDSAVCERFIDAYEKAVK